MSSVTDRGSNRNQLTKRANNTPTQYIAQIDLFKQSNLASTPVGSGSQVDDNQDLQQLMNGKY